MPSQELAPAQAKYEFTHVDPDNPRCVEQILELTRALAWRRFGGEWNAAELVEDAVSLAWEFCQHGGGTPSTSPGLPFDGQPVAASSRDPFGASITVNHTRHAGVGKDSTNGSLPHTRQTPVTPWPFTSTFKNGNGH